MRPSLWKILKKTDTWTPHRYFGDEGLVNKTINSILGYMPTVAHWGWNGNARRYWDNM